jgi:hypothetical protein
MIHPKVTPGLECGPSKANAGNFSRLNARCFGNRFLPMMDQKSGFADSFAINLPQIF